MYTQYRRFPFFAARADLIVQRFPTASSILVAGCGPGFLVDELLQRGRNAYGCDASPWAIQTKGPAVLPGPSIARLRLFSVLVRANMTAMRAAAGLSGGTLFSVVVTEDLLPVLTDAEVTTALAELRRIGTTLFHVITPGSPTDPRKLAGLNWKPIAGPGGWKSVVGTDAILDAEMGTIT